MHSHFLNILSYSFFFFLPLPPSPPTPSHLAVFLSFHSPPPLSPTHPLNQSFIPFSFSSPCFHVSNFALPVGLFHPACFSCFMPHLTCVCPLFLLCFSYFLLLFIAPLPIQLAVLTSSHHIYCIFLSFRLPSLPLVLPLLCLFLTSVFQAHCLFSVLSETVVQAVQGSYQPQ